MLLILIKENLLHYNLNPTKPKAARV